MFAAFAGEPRTVCTELSAVMHRPSWRGVAAERFRGVLKVPMNDLAKSATNFETRAAALQNYAKALDIATVDLPALRSRLIDNLAAADHPRAGYLAALSADTLRATAWRFKTVYDCWADAVEGVP